MFNRLNRALQQHLDPNRPGPSPRQPTLETLMPGDVISFWDGGDSVVQSVLQCREELNRRETLWRWNVLDEGKVLEISPDGTWLYERTDVLHQTSAEFETLTSDPDQGGVLKAFEARVREGIAARNPTLFEYNDTVYRVVSTGIFEARPLEHAGYPNLEVWRDINPNDPGDNVYFELEPTEDVPEGTSGSEVLGIWTTHIALLFGRPVKAGDVQSIYPRSEEAQNR